MDRRKKWAACSIALAGLLIFYFFILPGILKRQAVRLISQGNPDISVAVESAAPSLPAGVRLGNVVVKLKNGKSVEARKLDVQARLIKLLGGKLSLAVDSALYGGRLYGAINFLNFFSSSGPFAAHFTFEDIKAGDCKVLSFGRQLTGKLSGSVELAGDTEKVLQGEGGMQLKLINGMLPLAPNSMGLELLAFEKLEADAALGEGILNINRLELTDKAAKGEFQGQIKIDPEAPENSQFRLQGQLTFSFDPGRSHTAVLLGTYANPALNIM
jgi:type II secretion system protein N